MLGENLLRLLILVEDFLRHLLFDLFLSYSLAMNACLIQFLFILRLSGLILSYMFNCLFLALFRQLVSRKLLLNKRGGCVILLMSYSVELFFIFQILEFVARSTFVWVMTLKKMFLVFFIDLM